MTHRNTSTIVSSLACLAFVISACGGNSVGEQSIPQATLEGDDLQGNILRLDRNLEDGTRQSEPDAFQIRSSGEAPLEITDIDVRPETLPGRVLFNGPETETSCEYSNTSSRTELICEYDSERVPYTNDRSGNCSDDQYCNDATGQCHSTQLPETPIEVDNSEEFEFLLAGSEQGEVICPEPPSERPEEFVDSQANWNRIQENYCGEVRISTNASNSGSGVVDGDIRIYLLVDTGSGQIETSESNLSFKDVRFGQKTEAKPLTVLNNGCGNLEIERIQAETNSQFIDISGPDLPTTIPGDRQTEGGESQTWQISIDPPSSQENREIPSSSTLRIVSSAANAPEEGERVGIDISTPTTGPAIEFIDDQDNFKTTASFENDNEEVIRIRNVGTKGSLLVLKDVEFIPYCPTQQCDIQQRTERLEQAYSLQLGGTSIDEPGRIQGTERSINEGDEPQTLTITYDDSGTSPPPLGYLEIGHNDTTSGERSRIALLGPRSGAFIEVLPEATTFQHNNQSQTRTLLLRNRGTTSIEMEPPADDDLTSVFDITNPSGSNDKWTVEPGALKAITLKFLGTSQQETLSNNNITFTSIEEAVQSEINFSTRTEKNTIGLEPSIETSFRAKNSSETEKPVPKVDSLLTFESRTMPTLDEGSYQWLVLERPAESRVFRARPAGSESTFQLRPDEPGTYRIGYTVRPSAPGEDGEAQVFESYEVTASSSSEGGSGN